MSADRFHHVFAKDDPNPSNPCPFCDSGGLNLCSVDFSKDCKVCTGNGWYYKAEGGGTEPQPEGSPAIYGMSLVKTTCNCMTVSVQCSYCENVLTGCVIRKEEPPRRKTHAEAMALLPEEWTILSSEDGSQYSSVRFAVRDPRTGKIGMGHAEFWREPDIDEYGSKSPHPIRDEEWRVDPESGFGLTLEEAKAVLDMLVKP